MFSTYTIDTAIDFATLTSSLTFEQVAATRQVANAALINSAGHIPIVRTTTAYKHQVQPMPPAFLALRDAIIKAIMTTTGRSCAEVEFNNAMVELYDPAYTKMGFHTDQAQDLAEGSTIAIFSCYETSPPNDKHMKTSPPRLLIVNDKRSDSEKDVTEFPMHDSSCITFSTATNALHKHKIVGGGCTRRWLGLTFRTSKTYVERRGEELELYFVGSGRLLRKATEEEKVEIRRCKGRENAEVEFEWPVMDVTMSEH